MISSVQLDTISNVISYTIPNIQRIIDEQHVDNIYNDQKTDIDNGIGLTILQSITICNLNDDICYVIDGQHRIKAFTRLLDEGYDIGNIMIPVVKYSITNLEIMYELYRKINYSRPIHNFELSDGWTTFGKILCDKLNDKYSSYFTYLKPGNTRVNIPRLSFTNFQSALEKRSKCLSLMDPNVVFAKIVMINEFIHRSLYFMFDDDIIRKVNKCINHKREPDEDILYLSLFGDEHHGYLDIVILMITNQYENVTDIPNFRFGQFMVSTKKSLPKSLRNRVWNRINNNNDTGVCYVCSEELDKLNFHCGHIVSRYLGGKDNIDNLLPICSACNLSMGIQNLHEYKDKYF